MCAIDDDGVIDIYAWSKTMNGEKVKMSDNATLHLHLPIDPTKNEMKRYDRIQRYFTQFMLENDMVGFERYAFSASGKITAIAEANGILKHRAYSMGCDVIESVSPKTIKKFATGNGNASKFEMVDAFQADFPDIDVYDMIKAKRGNKSIKAPLTDICDAYFLAKYIIANRD